MKIRLLPRFCLPVLCGAVGTLLPGCRRAELQAQRPVTVRVAAVEVISQGRELHLSGTMEAERSINLSFAVPGTVKQVLVEEGAVVSSRQPLARLDARSYQDAADLAEAKADQAEDARKRFELLHRNGTMPDIKWVEVETGRRQARSALSLARKNLEDTVLVAPEEGVISRRIVEPGLNVLPGEPVLVLVQSDTMFAAVPVPEREISAVRIGQPARLTIAALGRTFEGSVREIGMMADVLTRTYRVKIAVPNPERALKVGMVAEVAMPKKAEGGPVVVVPLETVRLNDIGATCVYVLGDDGVLHRRSVVVSGYVGERIALAAGVAAGERVVVSGTAMLADGGSAVVAGTAGGR